VHFLYILSAITPAILILLFVYKQDKFPEPKRIVFKTFLFGCATVLGIDLIIPVLDNFNENYFKDNTFYFFESFIRAAFLEELFKLMVIVFFCTRKADFDEPMDGLVYGVAASLGFAAYENIGYVLNFYEDPSFSIAIYRAFTAVPLHGLCGIIMGFLVTQSIFEKKYNYLNLILALLVPVGLHGLYNFSYSSPSVSYQMANVVLFVSFIRVIFMFKNLKSKQTSGTITSKKNYFININRFIQSTSTVLLVYLVLLYLVNISS
jgi:RsiW-degrading membrane proteinase PrsW (M82 family)